MSYYLLHVIYQIIYEFLLYIIQVIYMVIDISHTTHTFIDLFMSVKELQVTNLIACFIGE